jgi:hypothetical protein
MATHKKPATRATDTVDAAVPEGFEPTRVDTDRTGTDDRDSRGRDGEGLEYRPVLPATPDDETVDGEDGSSAEWLEAGIDGEPRLNDTLQRGDEPIRDEVLDALSEIADVGDGDVEVEVDEGEVTLSGTVPDRRAQLAAEEAARGVSGVTDVESTIEIE